MTTTTTPTITGHITPTATVRTTTIIIINIIIISIFITIVSWHELSLKQSFFGLCQHHSTSLDNLLHLSGLDVR